MSGRSVLADDDLEEDVDLEEVDDSEEEESETETPQTPQQPSNFEERFKGLQGTVQNVTEQNRILQTQLLQFQAQQAYAGLIAQGRTEEEAQGMVQTALAQELLKQQGNNINSKEQALEAAARGVTAQALAVHYNIPLNSPEYQRIAKVKDPEDMEAMAQLVSSKSKVKANSKRPAGADKFGSGRSSGSSPKNKPKNMTEAADRFSKIKIEM
jgi:hypothetical protein